MNADPVSSNPVVVADSYPAHHCRSVSWAAIFAGLTAAMALQVLFMMLGAGLGFANYNPLTDADSVADLGKGAIIVQGLSAVFSLWFGGWVAGRFAPVNTRSTGWLHGFIVWCAATVAGVLIVSFGAGWALGDLSKLVGGGLSMAGKPAAALAESAGSVVKDAAKKTSDTLGSYVEEAVGNPATGTTANVTTRAKREIGFAVARLFNPAQEGDTAANRAALIKTLTETTGMSQADADKLVTEWTESYDQLKADLKALKDKAELKAREAGEKAANALAVFSLCAFVAFVVGALAASLGGRTGACHAYTRYRATTVL